MEKTVYFPSGSTVSLGISRSDESLFFFFDLLSLGKPLMETLVVIPPCVTVRRSLD